MVAVKGKSIASRVMEDVTTSKTAGYRKFKIYAENDKVKPIRSDSVDDEIKRKSLPVKNGCQGTTTNSKIKVALKNIENTKGKNDKSAMRNTGRKVLADISNVKGDASKTVIRGVAKPLTTKATSNRYLQRSSLGTGHTNATSSTRKPLTGNSRVSLSQVTANHYTGRRDTRDRNDIKVSSGDLQTNFQGRKSFNNVGRTSLIPRPPTRNSLPVLKRANKIDSSEAEKKNAEYTGQIKEKCGFSVKLKVGRKTLPSGSNSGSYLTTNQARGFGGQLKVDSRASSRKLVKSTAKLKVENLDPRTTLKEVGAATLSKRENKVLTTSLSSIKRPPLVVANKQPAQDELASDSNSNEVQNASDDIARKKSGRRRSYTTLLMATSKLLKEQIKNDEQDCLPNIDQDSNHLDVAEYVDEIYQYYWVMEAHHQPLQNYMDMQKEITPHMRGVLVNWLIEVHQKFDLMQETLYLMVTLLDRYISSVSIKRTEMQLVGLTSLLLASKYEDFWHPKVTDLISISGESYTRDQMLRMESAMLEKLKFRLNAPTPYVFMLRFLKAAQSDPKFEHLAFYLIELSLVEYEAVDFKPSLLCASAIYLARCTLQMTPAWTPLLGKHAQYEESQMRDCAKSLLKFQRAAKKGELNITYQKFLRPDYSKVAAIRPLDRLPL
ncbi:putative cyclin-B3-1 [Daucus carota subsp. sativus]|uniref:putative cyclin-B3-1 n=1 Tax=Daucus carota subsp. sativus TaxID=79200 RepID=UPI0007F04579|nr:PREDICTED: putative cyclin-B3-1 [Daucus carota subsp. sativus]